MVLRDPCTLVCSAYWIDVMRLHVSMAALPAYRYLRVLYFECRAFNSILRDHMPTYLLTGEPSVNTYSYRVTYTASSASLGQPPCMLWGGLEAKEVGMSFCIPLAAYYHDIYGYLKGSNRIAIPVRELLWLCAIELDSHGIRFAFCAWTVAIGNAQRRSLHL